MSNENTTDTTLNSSTETFSTTAIIFSDQPDTLHELVAAIESEGIAVILLDAALSLPPTTLSNLQQTSLFVVVDCTPGKLQPNLAKLRAVPQFANVPILVRLERIPQLHLIAGVCPQYRALACHHDEFMKLLRHSRPGSAKDEWTGKSPSL